MRWEREFKPCPFCGSEAELQKNSEQFDQTTQGLTVRWEVRCKRGCVSMYAGTTYKLTNKERLIVCGEDGIEKLRKRWNRRDYRDDKWADLTTILSMINDAQTVDAVEVVRCKDCRYWNNNKGKYNHRCIRGEWFYDGFDLWTKAEDYCSFGERRERDDKNTAEDKAL